uniref:Cytochrome P450 n=1 Tax=Rhabditophanes sp. KR3021 TaxID=114890 RepID=A0AC35TTB6_9BILA
MYLFFYFASTILMAFAVKYYFDRKKFLSIRKDMNLKGPPTDFFTGNILDRLKYNKAMGLDHSAEYFNDNFEKYGDSYSFYIGWYHCVHTRDMDLIKEVFIKQFDKFVDRNSIHFTEKLGLGESLIQIGRDGTNGIGWKQIRSVISPAFSSGKLREMYPMIKERCQALTKSIKSRNQKDQTFKVMEEFHSMTMDVIARCAFAIGSDAINNREDVFYVNARKYLTQLEIPTSWAFTISSLFPTLTNIALPLSLALKYEKPLTNGLYGILKQRKERYEEFKDHPDLIQLMLKSDSEKARANGVTAMPEKVIVANCLGFLLAGFETTSNALVFACYYLAKHPEIQQTLYNEIIDAFGEDGDITYDKVLKLPYLNAVYKENLRLNPPAGTFVGRKCVEDCVINGISFTKGTRVTIPTFALHWNEEYFPDAREFKPERFFEDAPAPVPNTYIPFGLGPRYCIGERFAALEFKECLVEMVRNFNITKHATLTPDPLPCYLANVVYKAIDPQDEAQSFAAKVAQFANATVNQMKNFVMTSDPIKVLINLTPADREKLKTLPADAFNVLKVAGLPSAQEMFIQLKDKNPIFKNVSDQFIAIAQNRSQILTPAALQFIIDSITQSVNYSDAILSGNKTISIEGVFEIERDQIVAFCHLVQADYVSFENAYPVSKFFFDNAGLKTTLCETTATSSFEDLKSIKKRLAMQILLIQAQAIIDAA